jgi:hypothetical protein
VWVWVVSTVLPLLDSVVAKMSKLEEVVGDQLESEGHVLAEMVMKHVHMCFWSWDPNTSVEPMVQGPITEVEEAASASVQDTAKLVAT